MGYIESIDGCHLYYDLKTKDQEKPVLVFVNGTGQTADNWHEQQRIFQADFSVLIYDARGQGFSEQGDNQFNLDLHCQDLRALMDVLAINRACLVGLSHGAHVALAFAVKWPERVNNLVLCSIDSKPSQRQKLYLELWIQLLQNDGLEAMFRSMLPVVFGSKFLQHHAGFLEKMVRAMTLRNKAQALMHHLQAVKSYPYPASLIPYIHCPVLVLSGDDDPLVTIEGSKRLADLCKGEYACIKGSGHSLPVEAPEYFSLLIKNFMLGRISSQMSGMMLADPSDAS